MLKDGDRVICVNDDNQKVIKFGQIYTVYHPDWMGIPTSQRVYIQENKTHGFLPCRFKKVES